MLLQIRDVGKSYATPQGKAVPVLRGVSLDLDRGQSIALTGESGSGKSTLLHLIAGLDTPDTGQIVVAGQSIATAHEAQRAAIRRNHIGIVFQQFNLVPSMTVAQNIALQSRLAGRHDQGFQDDLTDALGLADLVARFPDALSGGQQQRVAIARALLARPDVVLADEPTGNLDEATSDAVLHALMALVREHQTGLIMVTHSQAVAQRCQSQLTLRNGVL